MDERFEKRHEAGGEARLDAQKNKRTWRERFTDKFRGRFSNESIESTPEQEPIKPITPFEFVKGIFKDEPTVTKPQSWIEEAFASRESEVQRHQSTQEAKLSTLDNKTRTEFYMVVAERFREAGERFIAMTTSAATEKSLGEIEDLSNKVSEQAPPLVEQADLERVEEAVTAPPFDFAREMESHQSEAEQQTSTVTIESDPSYPEEVIARQQRGYLVDATPKSIRRDGEVTTYSYRPRLRDVLLGGALGGAYVARRKAKQTERKLESSMKKQEKEFTDTFDAQQAAIERIKKAVQMTESAQKVVVEKKVQSDQLPEIKTPEVIKPSAPTVHSVSEQASIPAPKIIEKVMFEPRSPKSSVEKTKEEFIKTFERERAQAVKPVQKEIKELRFDQLRPAEEKFERPKKESIKRIEPIEKVTPKEVRRYIEKTESFEHSGRTNKPDNFFIPDEVERQQSRSRQQPQTSAATSTQVSRDLSIESDDQMVRSQQNQWMSVAVIIVLIFVSIIFIATI